ncbi:hypothetical protein [Flavobacterium piscis]|uniref:Outer membrane protein beta-barrel domain-containing protein n=1 Tax=Flavobacterium piscis TaxID=1114874 RepID=A0ABU1Y8W9_9FLAO|nr:hypothetical protein [Flavobacterium piscis]MDR7210681.1 hypothetical protein [Flavobacterium piscis]
MKKMFFVLLITSVVQAQYSPKYDKLFMEAGIGIAIPLSGYSPSGNNRPLSLFHFQGGLRYMFNENIGVLGTVSFDQFNYGNQKNDQKLAGIELCYNLGNLLKLSRNTGGQFGLLVHGGGAVGVMSSQYNNRDYIAALMIGAKPYVAINDKVSFFADFTYKATLEQNLYFNGFPTKYPGPGEITAGQLGLTFGLIVSLGHNKFHADSFY